MYTEMIAFRCAPKTQLFLDAMAAVAEVSRSVMIQMLIMEGADKRNIQLVETEVKHEETD